MTIPAIGPITTGFTPLVAPQLHSGVAEAAASAASAAAPTAATGASSGADFGAALANGLERLQGLQNTSDNLAAKAATGDLKDMHDYMIAGTEASLATELTVAMRNKAVEAFNEIMKMPI